MAEVISSQKLISVLINRLTIINAPNVRFHLLWFPPIHLIVNTISHDPMNTVLVDLASEESVEISQLRRSRLPTYSSICDPGH